MVTNLNTKLDNKALQNRAEVQHEINMHPAPKVDMQLRTKTHDEKKELKLAKKEYKILCNTPRYINARNKMVHQILASRSPEWGGVTLSLIN